MPTYDLHCSRALSNKATWTQLPELAQRARSGNEAQMSVYMNDYKQVRKIINQKSTNGILNREIKKDMEAYRNMETYINRSKL